MRFHGSSTSPVNAVRKIVVAVVGASVIVVGLLLVVLPGPAVIVLPIGLAILATEFPWARKLLHWAHEHFNRVKAHIRQRPGRASLIAKVQR